MLRDEENGSYALNEALLDFTLIDSIPLINMQQLLCLGFVQLTFTLFQR
jgi:hypothetical protein